MKIVLMGGAAVLALSPGLAHAATTDASDQPTIVVTGQRLVDTQPSSSSKETVTAESVSATVNTINVEDALRYAPDILVRKRHVGDTQDPITTRTSGVGSSARSLIYADGVLLSALIGNNNSAASPRWGMVAPEEIERIDVLYGPFSAAYPGNSIGAVVNITTRMPDALEFTAKAVASTQHFSQYGTGDDYPTGQLSAVLGDRIGPWRFWLAETHSDTRGQPLTYVVAVRPGTTSGTGAVTTGAFDDGNKLGQRVAVLGASGLEHQVQDNAKLKVSYDLPGGLLATYALGLFNQKDHSTVQGYLTNSTGAPVYAGALNIGGYAYNVAASAFSNGAYHLDETHYGQSLSLKSAPDRAFAWDAVVTSYDYDKDIQRTASTALPGGFASGTAGTISRLDGTGWVTGDVRARWRPFGAEDERTLTFGAHTDRFVFKNPKYATTDWVGGPQGAQTSYAQGKTETYALWLQGEAPLAPTLTLTAGARYEAWRAYDGYNYSLNPALSVTQPRLNADKLSPKLALEWRPAGGWTLSGRYGRAYRFPTVTELYQTVTTGAVLSVPNPNLKPERADGFDLSAERGWRKGKVRLSLFQETIRNDLISQSAPLLAGSSTLFNYVQNVDRVKTNGAEVVWEGIEVVPTLTLSGSVTYTDAKIKADAAFPTAVGKRLPQLPKLRSTLVATWRPARDWSATVAGRYAGRAFANLDNSDTYANTYTGFSAFFVMDARVRWQASPHWAVAVGAENLLNRKYFLFHPFPQRTILAELKYTLGASK